MAVAEEVVVDLVVRTQKLEEGFARARRGFDFLKTAFGALAAAGLAREFIKIADASKQLEAQLKLATAQFGNLAVAQADAKRIADATRSGIGETVKLYGNFLRASKETGRSQAEAARATETFSKALKIGGADAASAASATLQFGQALASGVLRGDEFNSIAEASPRILRLLAEAIGVPIGQLRSMAEQGKLTSDILFKALTDRKFTDGIDSEFRQLPVTFDQAMTAVSNAAIETFGAFDRGGQFSTALANFVTDGGKGFGDLASRAEAEGINIRATFVSLHDVFAPMLAGANSAFSGIRQDANYTRDTIANLLSGIDQIRNLLPDLQRRAQQFDERTFGRRLGFTGDVGPRSNLSGQFSRGYRREAARSRLDASIARLEALGFVVPRALDGTVDEANIKRRTIVPSLKSAPTGSSTSDKKGRKAALKSDASKAAMAAEDFAKDFRRALLRIEDPTIFGPGEEMDRAQRQFRGVFGTEGKDYANPFAGVSDYDKSIKDFNDKAEDAARMRRDQEEDNIYYLSGLYEDAFDRGIGGIWENFKREGIRAIALVLAQLTLGKSLGQALGSLGNTGGSGNIGGIGSTIASLFAKRASGGDVSAGRIYHINEGGSRKELFQPAQSGKIYPTGALQAKQAGGGQSVFLTQTFTLDARGGITTPQLLQYVNQTARTEATRAGQTAYQASPARAARLQNLGT